MHPQVDITKIAEGEYGYSVGMGDGDKRHVREDLASIAECLHDAATALAGHFDIAVLSFEGHPLGAYHVAAMEHRTLALAETLRLRLAARNARGERP
jgi:hypothetical protein